MSVIRGERGLLLVRVRDEIQMTIHAYQTLYESSIAFGIRKALQVLDNILKDPIHSVQCPEKNTEIPEKYPNYEKIYLKL